MGKGKKKKDKKEDNVKDSEEKYRRRWWLRAGPSFIQSRFMWKASRPNWTYDKEELEHPAKHVVLNYTFRGPPCHRTDQCRKLMKVLQDYLCKLLRYQDLTYNFYIGGDGNAYEGRGWFKHPKLQHELSEQCLEIAFMGEFPRPHDPPAKMMNTYNELVKYGIAQKYISEDYQYHEIRM